MTKTEAIKKLIEDNGGMATWSEIYDKIEIYYPAAKQSLYWQEGLRGVVNREASIYKRHFEYAGRGIIKIKT